MRQSQNNYAFIDGQNLYLAIQDAGWKLDYKKFAVYLREKYGVTKSFLCIGYVAGNADLYRSLQEAGFILIFKPVLMYKNGTAKGNVDAELVLHTMIEYKNYEKVVIVTGDGDFHCLVKYLIEQGKLRVVIIPNRSRFSALLKFKQFRPYLRYMNDLEVKLGYKKKSPHKDETL